MLQPRATIIVRRKADRSILELVEAPSLDDFTVSGLKAELQARHGVHAEVDISQVELAKRACAA